MAEWSRNNLACVNVWSTLYIMKQHQEVFRNAGNREMQDLLFYNTAASDEELKFEAEGIADFLDQAFIKTADAKYDNCDRNRALKDMVSILVDKNKTMAELAEQVDIDYEF